VLARWWWLLLIGPLVAAGAAAFLSSRSGDEFKSEAVVLVVSGSGLEASERLTNTYSGLVTLRPVLTEVRNRLSLDLTEDELEDRIEASASFSDQLIHIAVRDESPLRAAAIANTTAQVFVERTNQQVSALAQPPGSQPDPSQPAQPPRPGTVTVVEEAVPSRNSTKPSLPVNTGLAAGLGLLIALCIGIGFDSVGRALRPDEA
jgi:non-specific protein-tyrosine kinase